MRQFLLLIILLLLTSISAFSQQHGTGAILDDSAYNYPKLPQAVFSHPSPYISLRKFTPLPQDQGNCQSCVGWGCAYAAMTTSWALAHNYTDKNLITSNAFDPMYAYYSAANDCNSGSNIMNVLKVMQNQGIPQSKDLPAPAAPGIKVQTSKLQKIDYFDRLSELHADSESLVLSARTCLSFGRPVAIVMKIDNSLFDLTKKHPVWQPAKNPVNEQYHTMCVIGYDDKKQLFEIMNSWGRQWGDDGYFFMSYADYARQVAYSLQLVMNFADEKRINVTDLAGDVEIDEQIGPSKLRELKVIYNPFSKNFVTVKPYGKKNDLVIRLLNVKKNRIPYVIIAPIEDLDRLKPQLIYPVRKKADGITPAITKTGYSYTIRAKDRQGQPYKLSRYYMVITLFAEKTLDIDRLMADITDKDEKEIIETLTYQLKGRIIPADIAQNENPNVSVSIADLVGGDILMNSFLVSPAIN